MNQMIRWGVQDEYNNEKGIDEDANTSVLASGGTLVNFWHGYLSA